MNGLIFGLVAGFVLALAGTSVVDRPFRFLFLGTSLVLAHVLTGGQQ